MRWCACWKSTQNQTIIVVSHGGAIGTILRSLFGGHQMPVFTENCGVTQVAWQEGRWRLICHNERAHLTESSTPAVLPWSAPGQARTVIDHFDRVAAIMPPASSAQAEPGLRALVALAAPRPADKALDIGTGVGAVAFAFAPHVAHVTAIDISPAMLERAEQSRQALAAANIAIRWADAITLPYREASFDLVTCRDLCPYVRDAAALFAQLRRVLKVGGRLALDELIGSENPVKRATHQAIETQRDPAFVKLYSESEIELRLKECGLRIERAEVYDAPLDLEEWLTLAAADKDARNAVKKHGAIERRWRRGQDCAHGKARTARSPSPNGDCGSWHACPLARPAIRSIHNSRRDNNDAYSRRTATLLRPQ